MREALSQAVAQLIPPLIVALSGLLCALIAYATSYFRSKLKNTKIQDALDRLDQVAEDAVKDSQQRIIGSIKQGDNLPKMLLEAKSAALDSVMAHYGTKGIDELKKILGWDDIAKNLSTKVEAKVHDLKLERAKAGVDDTTPNKISPNQNL